MNQRLPNLIIAGAGKSGTTSLFMYLKQHPEICGSRIKETRYFSAIHSNRNLAPIEEYKRYFAHCEQQRYVLEASPDYLYGGKDVAQAIKKTSPDAKIVLILREPLSRLISAYRFSKALLQLPQEMLFSEYVQACEDHFTHHMQQDWESRRYWNVNAGFYCNYIPDWFDTFGDSLNITFFEYLKDSPIDFLKDISEFLQINRNPFDKADLSIENRTVNYRIGKLQRLAYAVNMRGEAFWRNHHSLKKIVRKVYHALNGKAFDEQFPKETIDYLRRLYAPYNERLATHLMDWGYVNVPDWCSLGLAGSSAIVDREAS